jgi:ABC-type polysaccharide/polyol phosphate export permease
VAGFGLVVGATASVFADAIEATRILLTILGFATPVFYPPAVVPARFHVVLEVNPLYHFLVLFRHLAYGGSLPGAATLGVCLGVPALAACAGAGSFVLVRRLLPTVL